MSCIVSSGNGISAFTGPVGMEELSARLVATSTLLSILTMTLIDSDEYLTSDDHSFLDMTCPISPKDHFLLGSHVGLDFVGETTRIVEDLATHEFAVPFHLCDVPCGGIEGSLCGAYWYASGARP